MVDKVQKIREEVERLQKRAEHNFNISLTENERQFWIGESNVLTLIEKYIDSLQEESDYCCGECTKWVNGKGCSREKQNTHCITDIACSEGIKRNNTQEEPVKIKKGCKYRCLCNMVNKDTGNISFIGGKIYIAPEDNTLVTEENGWRCDTSENTSNFELVKEPQVKESAKIQYVNDMCKENGNSLTQEPVSEGLESASDLELDWDDISVLNCLLNEVEHEFKKGLHEDKTYKGYCQEVLKRFKEERIKK